MALLAIGLMLCGCLRNSSQLSSPALSSPRPLFRNITEQAGLQYRWQLPGTSPRTLRDTIGYGCALFDFDGDGNLDIFLVGTPCALFRGNGQGIFTDVSTSAGLKNLRGTFSGIAVGDFNKDGFADIYLTAYRGGALLKNEGGKRFLDITQAANIAAQPWGTAAAFTDWDRDGELDLIIGNYVRFEPEKGTHTHCTLSDAFGKPIRTACGPIAYHPLRPALYRNLGDGRFALDTKRAEVLRGRCLGIATAPNGAIALANDEMAGDLLLPNGTNAADEQGVAYDRDGRVHGGMGLDWGDFDNDGGLDLVVATFRLEAKSLYRNLGDIGFRDDAYATGVGALTKPYVAFGVKFLDFDNDSWLDIAFANGHTQDNITALVPDATFAQSGQLLRNRGGSFEDAHPGDDFTKPILGRGLATGDFDNDGRIDVLLVDSDGAPRLLHNEVEKPGNWLGLRLLSHKRDAYGAIVTVTVGGRKLIRHCHTDGSYLSASDPRVHFGLGDATKIEAAEITWPDGRKSRVPEPLPLNRYLTLEQDAS